MIEPRRGASRLPRQGAARPLRRLRSRCLSDRSGVAAVEFALLVPVMLVCLAGMVDLGQALSVSRKVDQIAATVSDLVAQEATISTSDVTSILTGASAILLPYDTSGLVITVSAVTIGTSSNTVVWALQSSGTAPTAGSVTTAVIPSAITESGVQIIVAQVSYSYAPSFSSLFGGSYDFSHQHLSRPRESSTVALE